MDYYLWVFDLPFGLHIVIFTKTYYTKLGARMDRYGKFRATFGGSGVLYKI